MELQRKIRMHAMMVGLGAALLMAGSARAQQDMDPMYFNVDPGTPSASKAAMVRVAQNAPTKKGKEPTESAMALAMSDESTLEASVTRMTMVDVGVVLILLGGIVCIALYAKAATRRERMVRVSHTGAPYTHVSAATAQ